MHFCKGSKKKLWKASITYNKKRIFLGYFASEKEAAKAYNEKASELFGERAVLNEISESDG